jgi:hypothetical protein
MAGSMQHKSSFKREMVSLGSPFKRRPRGSFNSLRILFGRIRVLRVYGGDAYNPSLSDFEGVSTLLFDRYFVGELGIFWV